jgi:Ca2+/H+ antiporter
LKRSIWLRKTNFFLLLIPLVLFPKETGLDALFNEQLHVTPEPLILALAALALIPLAGFLESAVEELSELTNQFIGGFLHTSFTNIAELSIMAAVLLKFDSVQGPPRDRRRGDSQLTPFPRRLDTRRMLAERQDALQRGKCQ